MSTFYLPDLGEGLPDGEIVKWYVKVGDHIQSDEALVSVETAKAIVDVPSPFTGKIAKLYAKEGEVVPTGSPLVDFEGDEKKSSSTVAGEITEGKEVLSEQASAISKGTNVKILPAVRALAKKLNVELNTIIPTGAGDTITAEDVKKASENKQSTHFYEPLKGIRRSMAIAMTQSHAEVVPVTVIDDADISEWVNDKDYTVRVMLAMVKACEKEPALNAWYNTQVMGRRLMKEVHIGLAMDMAEGLFVPVIRDVQNKDASTLRSEIEIFKKQVADRTILPQQFQGSTIVLSNYGKYAGRYANPVVSLPTVAILGMGSIRQEPRVIKSQIMIRSILPLSLTFDHRAVTGGEATRFLGLLIECLQAKHNEIAST